MARLLAAEVIAVLAHMFEHVTVADGGAGEGQADARKIALEAEIRHQRGDDAGPRQAPILLPALGDRRHELVAVDDLAASRR